MGAPSKLNVIHKAAALTRARIYLLFIYYESTKRTLKTKYICGCRCYERLQPNTKEFTCLSYTEMVLELEHLKIETRLITEMFANVMGELDDGLFSILLRVAVHILT
jgi:hypothetical protein